jgi:peptide/nickel transport system substrate-binding protein
MRHAPRNLNILALVVLGCALGCAARTRRTPDDTLVYVVDTNLLELDPRWVVGSLETKVSRLLAPALVSVDQESLEPRLELAESVTAVDPLTWDVTVRDGVLFPDGQPLTARDVVYTFTTTLDPAMKGTQFRMFNERLTRVEQLDERRARFHLKEPLATFVTDLDYGIVQASEAQRHGGRWSGGVVVGAGAYRLASLRIGEAVLERNEHYWRGRPPLRRVIFRTLSDTNARLLVLVGGSADLTLNGVRLDLLPRVAEKPRLKVATGPSALLTYLMMKNDDPILADRRVRQAIALAVDREKIVRGKFGGRARLATGLIPPGHWAYEPDVARWDHDPARARRLLDEAGHPDPDGAGPRPRFTLAYKTSNDGFRVSVARLIAQDLADVGIAVDLRSFEFATFFADIKRGNYQLASMQTGEIAEPDMYYTFFHSSRIPTPELPDLANRWRYRSAEADQLIEAGRHELDRVARRTIYVALQRLMATDLPVIPLWHEDNVAVMNRDVEGFELVPTARIFSIDRVSKR